jgi:hypothetical protein
MVLDSSFRQSWRAALSISACVLETSLLRWTRYNDAKQSHDSSRYTPVTFECGNEGDLGRKYDIFLLRTNEYKAHFSIDGTTQAQFLTG